MGVVDNSLRLRRALGYPAVLVWLTLGEWRIFQRLLFQPGDNLSFVLTNVQGVLVGTPVSKSWQQRFLAPAAVAALDTLTRNRLSSLRVFYLLTLLGSNLLLFALLRRKSASAWSALMTVIGFGFVHLLLTYKLEYPWDALDIGLFLVFGFWVSQRRPLLPLTPLLLLGTLNHETVLYIPLFYLLAPLERGRRQAAGWKRDTAWALLVGLGIGASVLYLRQRFYLGRPALPASTFEPVTPVISNHLHVEHNLRQLFYFDWIEGRVFICVGLLSAVGVLLACVYRRVQLTVALWSLCLLASIVCFGYVNETRHYLLLVAFWFAYAMPLGSSAVGRHGAVGEP